MAFPVRFTRRLMSLLIRVLVAAIVVVGVATLVTQMYMMNDEYVSELAEKRMFGLFEEDRADRSLDFDLHVDDYQWPTTTPPSAARIFTADFSNAEEEAWEEATRPATGLADLSDADMTAPPDDDLVAWFGVTSTLPAEEAVATTLMETEINAQASTRDEIAEQADTYFTTTQASAVVQTTDELAVEFEADTGVSETPPSATEEDYDLGVYSYDEETMTSEVPQSAIPDQNLHTTKAFSQMLITFDTDTTHSPEDEEVNNEYDDTGITVMEDAERGEGETGYYGDETVGNDGEMTSYSSQDANSDEEGSWKAPPILQPETNLTTSAVERRERPQYILPVFRGIGQGPNNQYLSFKAVVLYAMLHNKTLVLPPFFNHHKITEDDVRGFDETFNADLLGTLVPVATLEEFKRDCNNRVDAVLYTKPCLHSHSCYFDSIYRTMIPIFEILTGVKFPSKEDADASGTMPITMLPTDPIYTHESIYQYLYNIKDTFRTDSPCAAMFYPFPFMKLMMRAYSNDIFAKLEQHLARALYIRRMADYYLRTVLENRQFLAVHWRMNYDFKIVWCGRRMECRWGCQYIYKKNSSEEITTTFLGIMQAFNLSAVYFAAPQMQNQKVWETVKAKIPNAYNSSSLVTSLKGLDIPEITSPLEDDNYVISLVEQELCYRASIFIGTAVSTWTYMVEQQRLGKGTLFMPDVFGDPEGNCR